MTEHASRTKTHTHIHMLLPWKLTEKHTLILNCTFTQVYLHYYLWIMQMHDDHVTFWWQPNCK